MVGGSVLILVSWILECVVIATLRPVSTTMSENTEISMCHLYQTTLMDLIVQLKELSTSYAIGRLVVCADMFKSTQELIDSLATSLSLQFVFNIVQCTCTDRISILKDSIMPVKQAVAAMLVHG